MPSGDRITRLTIEGVRKIGEFEFLAGLGARGRTGSHE
jgi:hypothetical protein